MKDHMQGESKDDRQVEPKEDNHEKLKYDRQRVQRMTGSGK